MKIEKEQIITFLQTLFSPGDVFEIRILNAVAFNPRNGYTSNPHTESGYFDYYHISDIPNQLEHITSADGVYVTMNPVKPELLARSANEIKFTKRGMTTNDEQIKKRRWMLVDCDPKRESGISSSDEEHQNAIDKALEIVVGMKSIDWPEPVCVDSGNGMHLYYLIDLPADDNGKVMKCISQISNCSDDNVEIDKAVFNPSRIVRLPGTMNCKGSDIPERPHRMARIYSVPEDSIGVVDNELIDKLVVYEDSRIEESMMSNVSFFGNSSSFDIDEWIKKYCHEAKSPVPYKDGRKWILEECPFNHEHKAPDSAIYQRANGAVAFKCSHNHCSQYGWHDLRNLKEPGWNEKKFSSENFDDVDISGITGEKKNSNTISFPWCNELDDVPSEELEEKSCCVDFPESVYSIGGLVGDVMKFTYEYATVPNRTLALSGALSLMSFLCSRKVKTRTGLRSNIYILALANSGTGKERPRSVNSEILHSLGYSSCVIDNVASGEGLEDMLAKNSSVIWQCDEFYSVLHDMTIDTPDHRQSLMKYLLSVYTSSGSILQTRAKANNECTVISNPHLTVYATTTPAGFFENLSDRFLNDGMYARLNVIMSNDSGSPQLKSIPEVPKELIERAKKWRDYIPDSSGNIDIKASLVPSTDEAVAIEESIFNEQFATLQKLRSDDEQNEWKQSIWNRYYEMTMKYALIHACSCCDSPENAVITAESVRWANSFVKWEITNKIKMTERKYYRSEFEKLGERIIDFMLAWHRKNGRVPMESWRFNRKIKFIKDSRFVIESLEKQKRLIHAVIKTATKPREVYWIPQYSPETEDCNANIRSVE